MKAARMNEYASVNDQLQKINDPDQPQASGSGDVYSDLMAKEQRVLDLIRRVDDTRRLEAINGDDKLAPLLAAYVKGLASFVDRALRYSASGQHANLLSLVSSSDGMVYAGTLLVAISVLMMFFGAF